MAIYQLPMQVHVRVEWVMDVCVRVCVRACVRVCVCMCSSLHVCMYIHVHQWFWVSEIENILLL